MTIPKDFKYSKNHEWLRIEGSLATIGITHFAQAQLGDVAFVDLPEEGEAIVAGKAFCAIESVKAAEDVYAPVSGVIREVNAGLAEAPETINLDAYGEGWIVKVEMTDESELETLLDSKAYETLCAGEGH